MPGLGAVLLAAVWVAGLPALDAPWLLGDEHIFIVRNPEVTGAGLSPDSLWQRLRLILRFPPQEDLYQPLPVLTYALEWTLAPNSPITVRRTDLLLHALNALLLWWVLRRLLARAGPDAPPALSLPLSWSLALLWALHPVVVNTYAADMGRTHLLSATFALLSLGWHVQALAPGRGHVFAAALAALFAAMLCKAVVGWVLLALILEAALLGWRRAVRSWRIYAVGVICAGFAILTYWTSRRSGLVQDAAAGLFGDPLSRSALAVWIYFRNLVAPFWLSPWYLPDPETGWGHALVWLGLLLAALSIVHALRAWRHPERRSSTVGWAWCWATLLPVIGLVGAREAAAVDRYLYQPLMGVLLVVGTVLLGRLVRHARDRAATLGRPILAGAAVLGTALLLWDRPHAAMYRSTLRRAERTVALNPGDPRALEGLAAACHFATNHPLPADDLPPLRTGETPYGHFLARGVATLRQAAAASRLERYFPGPADRAPFHRRVSYMFKMARQYADSLEQAQRARELDPDAFLTWVRLAHAYQGLERWDEALQAYARCEERLPDSPETRATHFTDFGYLLLFDLEQAEAATDLEAARLAYPKFQAAVATGCAPALAYVGLARCEIRVGQGGRGFEIVAGVLESEPGHVLAHLVAAEYHLRSHHWEEAYRAYAQLVAAYPQLYSRGDWYYEALRAFQTACDQLGRWQDAALAWDAAVELHPDSREFRSFRVWAVACQGQDDVAAWANDLLARDPENPLACLAEMLDALRRGQVSEAVEWVRRAQRGTPIPRARELERAAVTVRRLLERGALLPEAALAEAAIYVALHAPERARGALDSLGPNAVDVRWQPLADELRKQISDGSTP